MAGSETSSTIELELTRPAVGGEVVGREASGRVVFVAGGLPGERVRVTLREQRRDFARGIVAEVLSPSPDRVAPPCPAVARGCGGCDLQHVQVDAQPRLKERVVRDALVRLGRLEEPVVELATPLPAEGFRTTVRLAVRGGRAGFRRRRSHDTVELDHCLVAHPLVDELLAEGEFGTAEEVTLRAGVATGERLALVSPTAAGVRLPDDVVVVGADELRRGRPACYHEIVDGARYRISATSFFQSRTDGAAALVAEVRRAAGPLAAGPARIVDAYCGVGLFAKALRPGEGRSITAIERGRSSVADARHNLADTDVRMVRADVAEWVALPADLVVADPSRDGLGRAAVARLARTGAQRLVLVSCDAGALGRDAGLLEESGLRLQRATLVDLFPHTHHLEVVSTFVRA